MMEVVVVVDCDMWWLAQPGTVSSGTLTDISRFQKKIDFLCFNLNRIPIK